MINVQAVASYLASQPGGSGDSELVASLLTIANTIATSPPGSVPAGAATPGSLARMLEAHTGLSAAPGSGAKHSRPSSGGARPTATDEDVEASAEVALAQGIRMFVQRYPVDTRAYEYLVTSSSVVVAHVLRDFRPQREGDADYSSLVTSYVKRVRGMYIEPRGPSSGLSHGGPSHGGPRTSGPPNGAAPPPWRSGAAPANASVPKARSGGGVPRDLAAALVTPGLDEFFSRFPVDERAYDYFLHSSPDVQDTVLREFQVRKEGESSYAGLFTSFVKKCRMGSLSDSVGRGHLAGSSGQSEHVLDKVEFEEAVQEMESLVLEDFRARFPMDERAFQYLCGSPKEVQDKVRESFVPQRLEDSDFSAAVTAYVKTLRRQFQESQGGFNLERHEESVRVHHKREESQNINDEDRNEFFERWPCDARALDYFDASPVEVQAQVILEFKPRSEGDADYSAAVTAFIKRCRYPDKGKGKGKSTPSKPDGGWGPKRPRFC